MYSTIIFMLRYISLSIFDTLMDVDHYLFMR